LSENYKKFITLEQVKEKLKILKGSIVEINELNNDNLLKQSAVMVLIYPFKGESFSLILTKRNSKLKKHSGEISFPGGKVDRNKDKNKIDTALRECAEEIGVNPIDIEVLGVLEEVNTLTGFNITPIVGVLKHQIEFKINTDEVSKLLIVPIEPFLDVKSFKENVVDMQGIKMPIYNFDYVDEDGIKHSIWGVTAHIIVKLINILYNINLSKIQLERPPKEKILKILSSGLNNE